MPNRQTRCRQDPRSPNALQRDTQRLLAAQRSFEREIAARDSALADRQALLDAMTGAQMWPITRAQRKISAGVFATSASGDAAQTRPDERRIGQLKETVSSCSRAIRFSPALSAPCPLSHLEPIARLPHG